MSKQFVLYFLLYMLSFSESKATDYGRFRNLMASAHNSEDSAKKLCALTQNFNENSAAIQVAYKAIASLLMCKHLGNPLSQLSYFNNGKALLEKAIKLDDANAEIRFMRYCTQTNVPKILNYDSNIDEDKEKLISYLAKKKNNNEEDLYQNIKTYLLKSKFCSETEKKTINNL